MGAQQGKINHGESTLTEAERQQLKGLFSTIKGIHSPESGTCKKEVFQAYCASSFEDWLAGKIAAYISTTSASAGSKKSADSISFVAFQQFIATVLKGDLDEKVKFIFTICGDGSGSSQATISGASMMQYNQSLVKSYKKLVQDSSAAKSWIRCMQVDNPTDALALSLIQDLLYPFGQPKDLVSKTEDLSSRQFTLDELVTGIGKSLLFQNLSTTVFTQGFKFSSETNAVKNIIPHCLNAQPALLPSNFTLLDLSQVIFLNSHLPPELQSRWRFIFSSAAHGESFSKCLGSIQEKGATIIIIKDTHGRVFGGFAPASWKLGPKFFGTSQSFLFHLVPRFIAYSATGYNENFQYLNMAQKTLPNGLGMGGTIEYFGLWIDSEYGKGICSPSCTTYNCPQLSTDKEFQIAHMEVWGVGPEPEKEGVRLHALKKCYKKGVREPQSVLDKDPELRAVLEIMGRKTNASEGYRDVPEAQD